MPIPNTKINLASSVLSGDAYRLQPVAAGDFAQTVTGSSVAVWGAGLVDINGDGVPEVVVGAPGDSDKAVDAGRVFIVPGTASGTGTTGVGDNPAVVIIDGVNAGDLAGTAVSVINDLNGDGKADILIGAPGVNGTAGAAYVLWSPDTSAGIDLGNLEEGAGNGKGFVIYGENAGDQVGQVLTTIHDLNGDGFDEILVGASGSDAAGTDSGAAYVVWGTDSDASVDLATVATGNGGFRIVGEAAGDGTGMTLGTIHDLNGDGKDEILIGMPGHAGGDGAVYVVFGKSSGTEINLDNIAAGIGGFRITGAFGEGAGTAVSSIGDVNGDGIADILVAAPGSETAYVVFGKTTTGEVLLSDVASGNGGFAITPEPGSSLAELSVTGGFDFNRDGIPDIVIGVPHDGEGGPDAGAVYVIWGGSVGPIDLANIAKGIGGAKIVGTPGSLTGSFVSVLPDSNGDGVPELLIGSPGTGSEAVNVLFSPTSWQPDLNIYGTNGDDIMDIGYGGAHKIGAGDDTVLGLDGNDTISTGAGNDTLEGGDGADTLIGGSGNDTYIVADDFDTLVEEADGGIDTVLASVSTTLADNIENLQLTVDGLVGTGNALDNTITGSTGADVLDGGAGADTLIGGKGDDTYLVNDAGDVAQEIAGEGFDTVIASVDYTLTANIEALELTGTARVGTGNSLNNTLTGTIGNDTLDGATGADSLYGGAGDDTYYVDNIGDHAFELAGEGTDTVIASVNWTLEGQVERLELTGTARIGTGNSLDNTITGTTGNDTLDGAAGADTLIGGTGNDTYRIDNTGDRVTEGAGEGTDTVIASVDYTLADNVESLQLTGTARVGTGNALDNTITGTGFADTLDGGAGADTLIGGNGNDTYRVDNAGDTVSEALNAGTDTVIASVDYTLADNVETLQLTGTAHVGTGNAGDNTLLGTSGADTLSGLDGNDTLDGGAGADVMIGGSGDDTYYVDNPSDVVVEGVNGGNDTVVVSADWTLADNIENVRLVGTGHSLTGNTGNNELSGDAGDDTIDGGDGDDIEIGGDGNDTLISGSGSDSLVGGSGDDHYVLNGGHAHIEDFLGHDTIDASTATGNSYIDLSGSTVSNVAGSDCDLGHGGSSVLPLDVQFLQDLSGSFGDDIATVRGLVPQIVTALQGFQPDSMFGASTFVDKAVGPFGSTGEWVYNTALSLTSSGTLLANAYNAMVIRYGADEPEAQIESLMQLALHATEVGFRTNSARFVVLFTDAPFHKAGDGILAGITTPNNGDAVMDGSPAGTGEDYPLISQVTAALTAANIIPIFAIANGYESVYLNLVADLGRGTVVSLTADSSNVTTAITTGLTAATTTLIEDAIGGAGDDTMVGNRADNALTGGDGNDRLTGAGGNDTLNGGAGSDTAVFTGAQSDYRVTHLVDGSIKVEDLRTGTPDGVDILHDIEFMQFSDALVPTTTTVNAAPTAVTLSNTVTSAAENGGAIKVADVAVTDDGAGTNVFSLTGADAALFEIRDGAHGKELWFIGGDYETKHSYDVLVQVADPTVAGSTAVTAAFTLALTDVNDVAPVITTASTQSVLEGTTLVATLTSTDADTVGPATATFTITGGPDAALFDIVGGKLVFKVAPDHEGAKTDYVVEVTASDGLNSSVLSLAVTVTDRPGVTILGTAGNDTLSLVRVPLGQPKPTLEEDALYGFAGNDVLDGSAGADLLFGGAGNDTYYVDNTGDVAREDTVAGVDDGGTDTVISTVDFALGAFIENLTLAGLGNIDGTGNALANRITGNAGDNVLDGGAGNDSLNGAAGADILIGGEGDDALAGGADADVLLGGTGNDKLDGGTGADTLKGGAGNDTYIVDDAGDTIDESDGLGADSGGIDSVNASVSFTLGAFVENLTLTGTANLNGTGNSLDNRITGNTGNNILDGGAGNDMLIGNAGQDLLIGGIGNDKLDGGTGADTLQGGSGNDIYVVDDAGDLVDESNGLGADSGGIDTVNASISFTLGAFVENLTLTGTANLNGTGNDLDNRITGNTGNNILDGGAGNDVLTGNAGVDILIGGTGNDKLDGGTGADALQGGSGNDTYVVDDAGDTVDESDGLGADSGGIDTVNASISFTLGAFVENLALTGSANLNGTGNDLANRIIGNTGNNVLDGAAGNDVLIGNAGQDVLIGGAGIDTLTGGADADTFCFNHLLDGRDTITDFVTGLDHLRFDSAGFTGLHAGDVVQLAINGTLAAGIAGFTYNTTTHILAFDADGAGNQAAVEIAKFSTGTLSASDFLIV